MNKNLTIFLPHILSIAAIYLVMLVFFFPQMQGEKVNQHDIVQGRMMQGEITEFEKMSNDTYYWNNSMFGGMPWRMLTYGRESNLLGKLRPISGMFTKSPIKLFLTTSIMGYLCLVLLGVRPWLALLGALALSLNVNNLVLLSAGHNSKIATTASFPLIIGGMLYVLKNKSIIAQSAGALICGIGISLSIYTNHPQMLYYFLLVLAIWFIVQLLSNIKDLNKELFRGVGFLVVAALLGIGSNMVQLRSSFDLSKSTMRGAPVLEVDQTKAATSSSETNGLEWGYAMQWSNGWEDVLSFIVPRAAGGSSSEKISLDNESAEYISRKVKADKANVPLYWGKLPFTSGPYYIGAIMFFLFILSFFTLPRSWSIAFGVGSLSIVLISLGKNFEGFNRLVFENLPFFNKFRAPNSIFHATSVFFVFAGILGVQNFIKQDDKKKALKSLYIATGISAGVCVILALLGPSIFDFSYANDANYPQEFKELILSDRASLLRADSFRSLAFILGAAAALWVFITDKIKNKDIVIGILAILCLIDLWYVDRRYFGEDNWVSNTQFKSSFRPRKVDDQIKKLEPKGRPYYRVHDLSINSWNSASTSFHHNTIGGYNAAKQQRFQDIMDRYLFKGDINVMNMLNTKYVISQKQQIQQNSGALGNAWFIKDLKKVNTANDEIGSIANIQVDQTAVLNINDFQDLKELKAGNGQGSISLKDYVPDHLVYESNSNTAQVAVFSETWYPKGWTALIDGNEVELFRVNYILRALAIPAGKHKVEFVFKPVVKGTGVSYFSSAILFLGLLVLLGYWIKRALNAPQKSPQSEIKLSNLRKPKTIKRKKTSKKRKS